MVKKLFQGLAIGGFAMFLTACQSDDTDTVVETEYGSITKEEFHAELEEKYGEETLQNMTKKLVLEGQFDIDQEEFEQEVEEFKTQLGPQFTQFINQQGYRNEEEFRSALYISKLEFEAATADIEVTDEEVQTHYERMQEERKARHILVDEKETAEEIIKKYNDGESFEDLAKEYSKDGSAANGGDLGYTTAGQMVKPFEDAMYGLEENVISEPVESKFGWHVILVEDIRESETEVQPFDEMKDQLREQLLASKVDPESYNSKVKEAMDKGKIDVSDDQYEGLFGSNKSESEDSEDESSDEDNEKKDSEEEKDDSESNDE
ncbi:peptidylprolyl isomerase [Allobacillus sp. GCM10007491]|uniref:Foldase protein PrsA n=1 Tax=Allobacillus saliphilus TaxID=2912308 RepID=A0A941CSB1_9BACI|nr:peptidylprolyl isomerase [Allobacillus saliphilus]MBR7553007.1 peptidylprolyl isomerase [Allobacillus saliphilus]